jgi:hypothetical protein
LKPKIATKYWLQYCFVLSLHNSIDMSKAEKLIARLLSQPKDFTYSELKTLLAFWGNEELQGAGSRVCFQSKKHKIKLHKPHPGNILKQYQIGLIVDEIKKEGLI